MSASLQRVDLGSTVRPNGSEAQAFEPGISAKNRPSAAHDFVDSAGDFFGYSKAHRRCEPQGRNCALGNFEIPGSMLRIAPE
ncbi:hypothetical protein JQ575_17465 [Bradyrhizobium sp. JYMT SZCCT0428]|nr:hypothetical protein [Bradyrhizobium sp. JYMT SZCCT0428]